MRVEPHILAVAARHDPEAVVFDLKNPAGPVVSGGFGQAGRDGGPIFGKAGRRTGLVAGSLSLVCSNAVRAIAKEPATVEQDELKEWCH
jgi:hypothetical protein